jgi:hypothetical protein
MSEMRRETSMGIPLQDISTHFAAAIAFNKSLGLSVKWKPAKTVSYRSGRGWYDYNNRASNYHVLLMDDFRAGRIKRNKGQFLCNAKITDMQTHQALNLSDMDVEASKIHKVTCPKCLERVAKLKK